MKMLRNHAVVLPALLALGAMYVWLNWFDEVGTLSGDGLIYFLTALDFAPYWPDDSLAQAIAATSLFPPVYPFLLMLAGGGASFLAAHVATAVLLLAAFAAFYAWLITLGIGRVQAAAGTVLFAILPGTFLQSFYLHPEGLYVAATLFALASLEVGERTTRTAWFWWASAAVGLALLTRTVGVTLLPGLAIVLLRHRPRGWVAMALLPIIPAAAWAIGQRPALSYTEVLVSKYGTASGLETLIADVAGLITAMVEGLMWNVVQGAGLVGVAAALGCVAALVAVWRFARGKADGWYVAAYLGVLAIWPYPQEAWRLTWVIVPILLGYLLLAGEVIYARAASLSGPVRAALRWVPVVAMTIVIVPGFTQYLGRAVDAVRLGEPELRHLPQWYEPDGKAAGVLARAQLETLQALREFAPLVPEGECMFSVSPLVTAYIVDRNVSHTPWDHQDDRSFNDEIASKGCRYFVMLGIRTRYKTPFYPQARLGERLEIIAEHRMGVPGTGGPLVALLGILRADPAETPSAD